MTLGDSLTGRLEQLVLSSELLRSNPLGDPYERPLWVYLPPGYDTESDRRYPSVYVLQGYGDQLASWHNFRAYRPTFPQAIDRMFAAGESPPAIVVFTDGERNYGRDPLESLAEANASNVRVHLIGVDLDEQIKDRPAVQGLIGAVRRYGGRYYEADNAAQLRRAYTSLDTLEKSLVISQTHVNDEPVYQWFALAAVLLIGAALAVNAVPFFNEMT